MSATNEARSPGKTTIAPDVLLSIAQLAALDVEGVSRMATPPSSVTQLFVRGHRKGGVRVHVEDNRVFVDLFITLKNDVNIRQVSRTIQKEVARAISEMVGMEVGQIDIHIEEIDFSTEE